MYAKPELMLEFALYQVDDESCKLYSTTLIFVTPDGYEYRHTYIVCISTS